MQMSYPDGEVLTYHYDSGGLVKGINGVKSGVRTDYMRRLEYDKFEQRAFLELGNGLKTAYAYDPFSRRLCALDTAKDAQATACRDFESAPDTAPGLQALVYQYDAVGNITGLRNTVAVPPANTFGGPVSQRFGYDDLYRLTRAEGSYRTSPSTQRDYQLEMAYDSIHNITSKQQADRVTQPGGAAITQKKTSYAWTYDYAQSGPASVRPHAPIHIGERAYQYDANGNQTGWDNDDNGTKRTIAWDEENRIQSVKDNGHEQTYRYDDSGERVIKRGPQGETVTVNQWYTIRDRSIATKHVWAGTSRLASRLVPGSASGGTPSSVTTTAPTFPGQGLAHRSETANLHAQNTVQNPHFAGTSTTTTTAGSTLPTRDNFLYYYHPDHLGSTSHVTDDNGKLFEHIEYFPFGESWVEESSNTQRTPYLFTGKELDEETGLYYFGARYYDARTSVWQSADPILDQYLDGSPNEGVFAPENVNLYSYVHNSPLAAVDPTGRSKVKVVTAPLAAKLASFVTHKHHTVPTEILKQLPKEVANNPLVRGTKGSPNRWSIPEDVHKKIHQGPGGGAYNETFKEKLQALGRKPTAEDVVKIREAMVKEFGLDKFRPQSAGGAVLREAGSAIAGATIVGLEVLDKLEPFQYLSSGGYGEIPGYEQTWFGAYKKTDPNAPTFYEAVRRAQEQEKASQ